MSYQYWVIRFVPNVARGEFSNIGIVCGQDGGDWAVGFDPRATRHRSALSADLRELQAWIRWFGNMINNHARVDMSYGADVHSGWVNHLRSRNANSVQFSEGRPIQAESARAGVTMLFPHLVEREVSRRSRSLNRQTLRMSVRDTYLHEYGYRLNRNLFVQPQARVGRQHGSFDIVRTNVSVQLTNVWAFNVATLDTLERDVQSWGYLVSRLRNDGARLAGTGSLTLDVPPDTPIEVVYDPPSRPERGSLRREIFEAAQEVWGLNQIEALSLDDFHRREDSRDAEMLNA